MLAVEIQQSSSMLQPLMWKEGKIFKVLFTITPSGDYVAGGDPLDLTQLFALAAGAPGSVAPTFEAVAKVTIQSARAAGAADNGNLFIYAFAPGTDLTNGTMQVFTGAAAQTALTELTAAAYPAGVLDDVIQGEAYFVMP